jgi:hypothetical protein
MPPLIRHSRESGNPCCDRKFKMDPRFRGDDGIGTAAHDVNGSPPPIEAFEGRLFAGMTALGTARHWVPRLMILILLADEPQCLMRSPQHVPLLEAHGEQAVHRS